MEAIRLIRHCAKHVYENPNVSVQNGNVCVNYFIVRKENVFAGLPCMVLIGFNVKNSVWFTILFDVCHKLPKLRYWSNEKISVWYWDLKFVGHSTSNNTINTN